MPRYLQKLVTRARVAALPFSVQPAFRAEGAEFAIPDALPELVEPLLPGSPALPEAGASVATVEGSSPEAPEHTIECRSQVIAPPPQSSDGRVEPRLLSREATPPEEKRPAEDRVEPPRPLEIPRIAPTLAPAIAQWTPPVVMVISQAEPRETVTQSANSSQSKRAEEHPVAGDVLSQLMPRLEAWFNQPSAREAQTEGDASQPRFGPPLREPETSPTSRPEEPRLVIGQIRVDVLPPPAPVPRLPVVRIPARSAHSPAAAGTIAKLGFGLGQT
jgi:hypothetical protein